MEKRMLNFASIALLGMALSFTACKKDPDPQPVGSETLKIQFNTTVGSTPAAYSVDYQNTDSLKYNLSLIRYYVSNFGVIKDDGTELSLGNDVFLIDPTSSACVLGKVPTGSYKGFFFHMGLDSVTNHGDPATYDATHPLSYQSPTMHWSWSTGYLFLRADGLVDTTGRDLSPNIPFEYHIATDELYRKISFPTSAFEVVNGSDALLTVRFDVNQMLAPVDMRSEIFTHTFDRPDLAALIADSYQNAFTVE